MSTIDDGSFKRVLFVDDDLDILHAMVRLFRKTSYEIKCAHDGEAACRDIGEWKPHLVILDVNMPGIDGYKVLELIQDEIEVEGMHVVMLTGRSSMKDMLKGFSQGAVYYITKPFKNEFVLNIVNYLIGDLSEEEKQELELKL